MKDLYQFNIYTFVWIEVLFSNIWSTKVGPLKSSILGFMSWYFRICTYHIISIIFVFILFPESKNIFESWSIEQSNFEGVRVPKIGTLKLSILGFMSWCFRICTLYISLIIFVFSLFPKSKFTSRPRPNFCRRVATKMVQNLPLKTVGKRILNLNIIENIPSLKFENFGIYTFMGVDKYFFLCVS